MPFEENLIPEAVSRYHRERDRYVKLADRVAQICRDDICDQNAIRAQVTYRVKSEKSLEGKLKRFSQAVEKNCKTVDDIFKNISNLAGVRIAAYRVEDCEVIIEHLSRKFSGPDGEVILDRKDKKQAGNENYYRAIHAQICLPKDDLVGTYDNVGDISCEIQICTMIAHVWNEIEHDIGYKRELGEPSHDETYNLSQLGTLVRQGDLIVSALLAANDKRISDSPVENAAENAIPDFADVHDFVSRMRNFANRSMPKFADNSGQLFDLLVDLELDNPQKIDKIFSGFSPKDIETKIRSFNISVEKSGIEGLKLDNQSSDLLLIGLLDRKMDNVLAKLDGRAGRGRGRPSRLHRIALRYNSKK